MNRKQFLSQLLTRENFILADEVEECPICKENYITKTTHSREADRQIRLPCNPNHTVGLRCILTWLRNHNTCPLCRYEFFAAETTCKGMLVELYVERFEGDDDTSASGEESDDMDFRIEGQWTDDEDENMSDNEDSGSEEDEMISDDEDSRSEEDEIMSDDEDSGSEEDEDMTDRDRSRE